MPSVLSWRMFWSGFVAVAAATGAWSVPFQADPAKADQAAPRPIDPMDVVRLMSVNDGAIRSVSGMHRSAVLDESGKAGTVQVGEFGFDAMNRWRFRGTVTLSRNGEVDFTPAGVESFFRDGLGRQWVSNEAAGQGLLRPSEDLERGWESLFMALGRDTTAKAEETLSELLARAQDLRVVRVESAESGPIVTIAGICELRLSVAEIEATIDVGNGGALRSWTRRDALYGTTVVQWETDEFETIRGVRVPISGRREYYERTPLPPEEDARFGAALAAKGLPARPDARDPRHRSLAREVVRELYPDGFPHIKRWETDRTFEAGAIVLNRWRDLDAAAIPYRIGAMVFDIYADRGFQVESIEQAAELLREQKEATVVVPSNAERPIRAERPAEERP